jgi:hypothetical protein
MHQHVVPFYGWVISHFLVMQACSLADGHLGCFHFLAIACKAARKTSADVCFNLPCVHIQEYIFWVVW